MYVLDSHWSNDAALGLQDLQHWRQPGHVYIPAKDDVARARALVCKAGMVPFELGMQILEAAGYVPGRRVPVPDDPLHEANAEELGKYLEECWRLLVRCDLLMKACGRSIDWYGEVVVCVKNLWCDPLDRQGEWIEDGQIDWDEDFADWEQDAYERY